MATATASLRGAKRKCQNDACALPFYDLRRTEFACPNCGTGFDVALALRNEASAAAPARGGYQKRMGRGFPMPVVAAVAAEPEVAEVEAVEDGIVDDGATVAGEDVILEQEDENEGAVDIGPLPEDGNDE